MRKNKLDTFDMQRADGRKHHDQKENPYRAVIFSELWVAVGKAAAMTCISE